MTRLSGAHTHHGAGAEALGPAALIVVAAVVVWYILSVIIWIAVALGVLLLLAVVALAWWLRGKPVRQAAWDARYAAAFGAERNRAAVPKVTATVIPQAVAGARPAIENHYHVHHHYADGDGPTRVPAISGQAGDAITGKE